MPDGDQFDARPVRTFLPRGGVQVDESAWPTSVPAMAQLLREGLELPAGLTVLAGENGSGKSTVTASLGLVALLHDLVAAGSQMVVATHSPIVAALLELGPWESGPPPGKT